MKQLLSKVLLSDVYKELALQMRDYIQPNIDQLVILALKTGNASLLDFLLENAKFAINTTLINDAKENPVQYCCSAFFAKSKEADKIKLKECLSVLIKHNASLMVKSKDGLPIAHDIMINAAHPLREAFTENADKTLSNLHLYRSLADAIQNHLECYPELDITRQDELRSYLAQYKNNLITNGTLSDRKSMPFLRRLDQSTTSIVRSLGDRTVDFKNDPEIKAKNDVLQVAATDYIRKIPEKDRSTFLSQSSKILEKLAESLSKTNESEEQYCKQTILKGLDNSIKAIMLRSQLFDLEQQIKKEVVARSNSKRGRSGNKKLNGMNRDRERLNDELKKIISEYSFLNLEKVDPVDQKKLVNDLVRNLEKSGDMLEILAKHLKQLAPLSAPLLDELELMGEEDEKAEPSCGPSQH